jgi:KTSC domain-containing protein
MPSTVISRYVYCPDKCELWVEFVSGRKYVYSDVPQQVADALGSAFAKGVYFNSRIRDCFACREIAHEDREAAATHS